MKTCFRSVAAFSTSESTALAMAGVIVVPLIMYTGYAIPQSNIVALLRWITYINVRARTCLHLCDVLMSLFIYSSTASPLCV